jgi:hypothetical protein
VNGDRHGRNLESLKSSVAVILALAPVVAALVDDIGANKWVGFSAWAGLILTVLAGAAILWPRRARFPPPPTVRFRPFPADGDGFLAWDRTKLVKLLYERLIRALAENAGLPESCGRRPTRRRLVVVTGVSAAGKSVLLRDLLPTFQPAPPASRHDAHPRPTPVGAQGAEQPVAATPACEQPEARAPAGFKCCYVPVDLDLDMALKEAVGLALHATCDIPRVIVLDRFERHLADLQAKTPADRRKAEKRARRKIDKVLSSAHARILIAVRQEWYFDLAWLGDRVPPPEESLHVDAIPPRVGNSMHRQIRGAFEHVLGDPQSVADVMSALDESLLPLELQLIGATVERNVNRLPPTGILDDLGGLYGAIDAYFEPILAAARPNRSVANKVLCALAVSTRFRRTQREADILDAVFESERDVHEALEYLVQQRLVLQRPSGGNEYEFTHDYLAAYFHRHTGSELDPTDRDNIIYHVEANRSRSNEDTDFVAPRYKRIRAGRVSLANVVAVLLVLGATARLLWCGIGWTLAFGPASQPVIAKTFFDATWIPIFITSMVWLFYIASFYNRILRHLNESPRARWFSRMTMINVAACTVAAMFVPYVWVAANAWGGMVLGLKVLSLSLLGGLDPLARRRLRLFAGLTIGNMVVLGIVGGAGIALSAIYVSPSHGTYLWTVLSTVVCAGLIYVCLTVARAHVLRTGVSQLLGLLARSSLRRTAAPPL